MRRQHARRRRTLRFPFDARAEVSEETPDAPKVVMRVSEISLNGCYLQTPVPFPDGTSLLVKIHVEGSFFEARATVAYSRSKIGMGVAFRQLKPYFVGVLKKWLLDAMQAKHKPSD